MALNVHQFGPDDGRPLIALHGLMGHGRRWRALAAEARPAVTPPPGTPTLLVVASRSRAVSPGYVDACRSVLGDQLTIATLDCGHLLYLEQPAETGRLIRRFLIPGSR